MTEISRSAQIAKSGKEFASVNDFDTVANAVAHCNTNNLPLYWPEVKTVTGNVPNFHSVKHFGSGGLKRGTNTWYVEQSPNQEDRRLYVSTASGAATNDGLDTTFPLAAEPAALTAMLTINPNHDEKGYITLKSDHIITDASMMQVYKVNAGWVVIEGDGTFGNSGYQEDNSRLAQPLSNTTGFTTAWEDGNGAQITDFTATPAGQNAVPVADDLTASTASRYIVAQEANAPELAIFVDGKNRLDRLYSITNSTGYIANYAGGKNFRDDGSASRPLYCSGGYVRASRTIWDTFSASCYISRGAGAHLGNSLFINRRAGNGNGSLVASRGASIEGMSCEFHNCDYAIEVKRAGSSLNVHRAVFTNTTSTIALVHRGGTLSADGCYAFDTVNEGFTVADAGTLSLGSGGTAYGFATIKAKTTGHDSSNAKHPTYAIRVTGSGTAAARSSTLSGFYQNVELEGNGQIDLSSATITGGRQYNILAEGSGEVEANSATITNAGNDNVRVAKNANVNLYAATVTGAGTNPLPESTTRKDIYFYRGGLVSAHECRTTTLVYENGSSSTPTPSTSDINPNTINTLTERGFILCKSA
tara:strand:- start:6882 stop:8645 length:1764 start_codon:yes stop_codon:yes gene_type:complete